MNAAEILTAVREAGAALRVEGGSLVASNASRLPPEIKTAIRENKPQIITALCRPSPSGKVLDPPDALPPGPRPRGTGGQRCVEDAKGSWATWGSQAEALGWSNRDLFGLHTPPANPHPSYSRLSRYDADRLDLAVAGQAGDCADRSHGGNPDPKTGNITTYRKHNKPGYGPVGDSLDDLA